MKHLLLAVMLVFVGAAVYAQTPDEETPANEGVCDGLIGGTPGLYGLCVAYCEAQDCDYEGLVSDQCNGPNSKILSNYERKMQPGDPYMPCLNQSPECPCFDYAQTEEVFSLISGAPDHCWYFDYSTATQDNLNGRIANYEGGWKDGINFVFGANAPPAGPEWRCIYHLDGVHLQVYEWEAQDIAPPEAQACFDIIKAVIDSHGGCP